ncbi:MAG: ATP-dependent helicase, partial [Planctomycetes bacterium]|nr:ATP-dependent helicase [Planctomycetota bacterium]
EGRFGKKNFLDLCSVFTSEPLFTVLHGRVEMGRVHPISFQATPGGHNVLSLAGRSWRVTHLDWNRRVAHVEQSSLLGKSRWMGTPAPLHYELCQAMRAVVVDPTCELPLTERARGGLEGLRASFAWAGASGTTMLSEGDSTTWWTFAGLKANVTLASLLAPVTPERPAADNLAIYLPEGTRLQPVLERLAEISQDPTLWACAPVTEDAVKGLKFSTCLPPDLAMGLLRARLADSRGVGCVVSAAPVCSSTPPHVETE